MGPWDYSPTGNWSQNSESRNRSMNSSRNNYNSGNRNQVRSNQRNSNQRTNNSRNNPRNNNQRNMNQRNINQRNNRPMPMNQGPMNQSPMNQNHINQMLMNQMNMNQGQMNMNQGQMSQGQMGHNHMNQNSSNQNNRNQNNRNQNNRNQINNRQSQHNQNDNPSTSNNQSDMQQGGYDVDQLERIKKAVKENRIEFVDGGARIIDADTTNMRLSDNNEDNRNINLNTGSEAENTFPDKEMSSNIIDIYGNNLKAFIQSERNATIFYKYLSSISNNKENTSTLEDLSNESKRHFNDLNTLYENKIGSKYEVKDSKINDIINFKEGIAWAISLENKGLIEMINFAENIDEESTYKKINSIINRKTCYISVLHLMLYNIKENISIEQL